MAYDSQYDSQHSEKINLAWDGLLVKYGAFELERRMSKMKSYRAYAQRWPFDMRGHIISLDVLLEAGYEMPDEASDLLDVIIANESADEFRGKMTPKQLELSERLEAGYRPKEFFKEMGYKNTGGLRWHRHILRKKHQQIKDNDLS